VWSPPRRSGTAWRPMAARFRAGPRWRSRWVGRLGAVRPFLDDGVELCPQQILVSADELEELLVHSAHDVGLDSTGAGLDTSEGEHGPHHQSQAVMACWPSFRLLISILRALACSATGIFNVSTPAS
jgi:hypothetical protein